MMLDNSETNKRVLLPDSAIPLSIPIIMLFVISAVAVTYLPGYNYVVIALGVLTGILFLFYSLSKGILFTPEIKLFSLFLLWSVFGMLVVVNPLVYYIKLWSLLQIYLMMVIVVNYSRTTNVVRLLLLSVLVGCLIVGFSGVLSGEYQRAESEGERAAGIAMNSNVFAVSLVIASAVLLYFFKTWKSWIMKAGCLGLLLLFIPLILSSGSRKGFIGFLLVLCLWFVFSYAQEIRRRPGVVLLALVIVSGIAVFMYLLSRGTVTEQRFREDVREDVRLQMYLWGLKLIATNPLLGIGLDQYTIRSPFELYSHSNYVEVFSSTGLPGGIAYYFIYLFLWLRLRRLNKIPMESKDRELVNLGKTYVCLRLVLDLVVVSYGEKMNWIFFAFLIGWSFSLEQKIKRSEQSYDSHLEVAPLEESMEVV